ncbi:GAF domain-containing protein [Ruminiclostridium josui]|uniref:GAF domain-containing protein n=1 Tax=Ruminiclostridium josui TaxID=1499 RepID=UPI000463C26F|nr:GAF domain-containing protein [Ruminiclostridium josui]
MKYQSILQRLEDEKKDEILSAKLYRYNGLMQAIEYFSQKLVFEQIIDAAFDFINELLLINNAIVYVLEESIYTAKRVKGFKDYVKEIENTSNFENLATFYGNILYEKEKIVRFFDSEMITNMDINAVVPLIIEGKLYGFIMINGKDFSDDDYIILESLMRLINNALENYSRYESLAKVNKVLDEKIFNLFAINQSSKVLLSELRIDALYDLAVELFSELTRSTVTGFILFDERSHRYILKGFKDVFYKIKDIFVSIELNKNYKIDSNKVIIDLENPKDRDYFFNLFEDSEEQVKAFNAKYIVIIIKESQILGFVTLSDTVTGDKYSSGIFELIESLASSMYIALSNADLFKQVNEQKQIIQRKLDKLVSLNKLTKNISSSLRIETLMEVTAKTLEISFNMQKGLLCLYDKESNEFSVSESIGLDGNLDKCIIPNDKWRRVFEGDYIYEIGQDKVTEYMGYEAAEKVGESQGILIVPIYVDTLEVELLGAIVIFKYDGLQLDNEENLITLETIAGHIAPVLKNLLVIQMQQRFMLPNYVELFKNELKHEVKAAMDYNINLSVIQVEDKRDFIFKGTSIIDSIKDNFKKVYPFSYNNVFIIENDDENIEDRIIKCTGVTDLKIRKMVLGKDFKNFANFFDLFR